MVFKDRECTLRNA